MKKHVLTDGNHTLTKKSSTILYEMQAWWCKCLNLLPEPTLFLTIESPPTTFIPFGFSMDRV